MPKGSLPSYPSKLQTRVTYPNPNKQFWMHIPTMLVLIEEICIQTRLQRFIHSLPHLQWCCNQVQFCQILTWFLHLMAPPLLVHLGQWLPRLPNSSTHSHLSIPVFMRIIYYVQKTNSHFSPIVHVTICHTNNPKIQKQLLISQWCALKLTWHGINRWGNSNTNLKRQKRKKW